MSSLTTCNQLTQQPSSTSSKNFKGIQLKSVLHSMSPDCNKTLPVYAKEQFQKIYHFFIFNNTPCTESRQSV